jgi:hypothetical protein
MNEILNTLIFFFTLNIMLIEIYKISKGDKL